MNTPSPVLIIGAGIGGLSAAIRLAASGHRVIMLEQNAAVGGKMGEVQQDGFRWDTGPSVITMRPVLAELFAAAGRNLEDYLTLQPIDPLTRYFYPDRCQLDLRRDWPTTAAQIAAIEPRDVEGYLRFLAAAAGLHRITAPVFTFGPPPSLSSFLRVPLSDALRVDPFRTLDAAIRAHLRSPHLRQLFGRFATYVGSSPYLAPATLAVIAHVELTEGIWYPQGGVYALARALHRLAVELGVEIRLNTRVRQILSKANRVQGVELDTGEKIPSGAIIANVDVATVEDHLLSQKPPPAAPRPSGDRSCSGFGLLLGVEGQSPQLAHHNIFFSSDYPREFDQIFRRGLPPDDPTIYLAITSKTDPAHAPPRCENWFVLVNVPALSARFNWQTQSEAYAECVLERLAARGFEVRNRLRVRRIWTPMDIAAATGAAGGALYGMSFNRRLAPFLRPRIRASLRGLFYAGGSVHPGGGVPMVILSGKLAADLVFTER
jgi:phytoene desaturase